jgi:hypothetical protein
MNGTAEHQETKRVEEEITALAEQLLRQVQRVNDITRKLVERIEGREPPRENRPYA